MPGSLKRTGPVALTTSLTTNIMQGGGGTAGLYDRVKKIRIVNKTSNTAKVSLWLGASGANTAGTEIMNARAVDGNKEIEVFGDLRLDTTDYIVGGSDTATALTITIEFERNAT